MAISAHCINQFHFGGVKTRDSDSRLAPEDPSWTYRHTATLTASIGQKTIKTPTGWNMTRQSQLDTSGHFRQGYQSRRPREMEPNRNSTLAHHKIP